MPWHDIFKPEEVFLIFFLEKINGWIKNQNGGQILKWRRVDFI
jgi:hypothetical protein